MKFAPDRSEAQTISGYGPGWLSVQNEKLTQSVILGSRGERVDWNCSQFEALTPAHFALLAEMPCEVIIFGSGNRIHFPPPAWLQPLMAKRIGLETMDTQAACRTYNILANEGRHVIAALLMET